MYLIHGQNSQSGSLETGKPSLWRSEAGKTRAQSYTAYSTVYVQGTFVKLLVSILYTVHYHSSYMILHYDYSNNKSLFTQSYVAIVYF